MIHKDYRFRAHQRPLNCHVLRFHVYAAFPKMASSSDHP